MKKFIFLLLILLVSVAAIFASPVESRDGAVVAFINDNVIPMNSERVLPNQTVIVRNGLIAEIGDAKKVKCQYSER